MKGFSDIRNILFMVILMDLTPMQAQNSLPDRDIFSDYISYEKIKTVMLFREGWNLSNPVIRLGSGEKLELHFDLLGDQPEEYYYTFIHCDKDWKRSDIFVNDYLEGLEDNPLENYTASFNTTVSYYHYRLTFPNERVNLKLSGNYIISVFQPGQKEHPVIMKRFIISEDAVAIEVNAHRPLMTRESNANQQVDFTVSYSGIDLNDPYRNVYAFVLQNGRWDNSKQNLKPDFYGNNQLKYNSLSVENIFQGGNEFRYFDIKSIRYISEYVRFIDFAAPYYNVFLQPSEDREFKPYFYSKDINGKYIIAFQEGKNPGFEADYVNVFFTLPAYTEIHDGDIFVSGAMNDWKYDSTNLMHYNQDKKQYECSMLLKQGWYNFEYTVLRKGDKRTYTGPFEGNHYETENDYLILLYYRNPRERYDRVIGSAIANTLNRMSD